MARIFLTGATGYVGGDVLHRLYASSTSKHSISCLVRTAAKAEEVSKACPDVRIVHGDLDDTQLIENEARNAHIALHLAATSHISSSTALAKGLGSPGRKNPGYWIQISGATLVAAEEIKAGKFGFKTDQTYDDVKDVEKVLSMIENNRQKRPVDSLVVSQDAAKVRSALVVGPHIYGVGRGSVNTRSVQAPEIARVTLKLKEGFRLGEGENNWSNVHVHDLSELIVSLVDAAIEGKSGVWNKEGIYFPENGNMEFGELCSKVAAEAHQQNLIPKASVERILNGEEADSLSGHASILWGTNAVLKSTRARSLLNWKPSRPSLEDEIPEIVRREEQLSKL